MAVSFPASFAQRRLWFIQRMSPASTAYNMVVKLSLPFRLDRQVLRSALDDLATRHEGLTTRFDFEDGDVVQIVGADGAIPMDVREAASAEEFDRIFSHAASQPFDLTEGPLIRVIFGEPSSLGFVMHHAIADGHSVQILLEDLNALYKARLENTRANLPELPIQYADFSVWQRRSLTPKRREKLLNYWKTRLEGGADVGPQHEAMTRDHPNARGMRGAVRRFSIPVSVCQQLRTLATSHGTTLFCALISAFAVTLSRFTGQPSIAIGTPVSGRTRAELDRVVGLFVNSVVFHAKLGDNPTFAELLARTGRQWAEDLSHQDLPFDLLVDELRIPRNADRNPVFQTMFQLQSGVSSPGSQEGNEVLTSQLDLSVIQHELPSGAIEGGMVFAADLFEASSIDQLTHAYLAVLADVAARPNSRIASVPRQVASVSSGERRAWPGPFTLHEWLAEEATRHPAEIAVVSGSLQISFAEFDRRSSVLAAKFRRSGVERGKIVGICIPRSIETIIAMVGVLKAGGCYLFLDAQVPTEWRNFVLDDSRAVVVAGLRGSESSAFGRPFVAVDGHFEPNGVIEAGVGPEDPAYVIYTSGSTGRPKGVVIPHRAIVNHMRWMLERFPLKTHDRVLQRTPLTFDASVWEIYAPLLSGTTMVVAHADARLSPELLADLLRRYRITTLQMAPTLLRELLHQGGIADCPSLRRVFCGGEALSAELRDQFFAASQAELINLYGPTETTIDATFHVCERNDRRQFVPIGKAVSNTEAWVLDQEQRILPPGAIGELYIAGDAVGLGYLGCQDLTEERFHPIEGVSAKPMYRTGDRVRMLARGELQYFGRLDAQVKVRGFRIELAEIESVLESNPHIAQAGVVVQDFGNGDQRLVAFLRSRQSGQPKLEDDARTWLQSRLPEYCVPSMFVIVPALPATRHGKLDRAALAQYPIHATVAPETTQGRTRLEREVCAAFAKVLRTDSVGIDDNFFHLGGHSILVIALQEQLRGIRVTDVFEHPTPRELAQVMEQNSRGAAVAGSRQSKEALVEAGGAH